MNKIWLLSSLCLLAFACDEDPAKATFGISILEPTEAARFTCSDDLNQNTADLIERDITVSLSIADDQRVNRLVKLIFDPPLLTDIPSQEIPPSKKLTFASVPLSNSPYKITAHLMDADTSLASDEVNISIVIDQNDPACVQQPASIQFLAPQAMDVLKGSADKDGDLKNGLQIDVSLSSEGNILNQLVELRQNDVLVGRKTFEDQKVIFTDVQLPLEGEVLLKAIAQGPQGLIEETLSVTVDAKTCDLSIFPQPSQNACDISAADDQDLEKTGLQVELIAQTNCDQVSFTVNGQVYELLEVDQRNGQASMIVTFNNGENQISAKGQSANGQSNQTSTYTLNADDRIATIDLVGLNQIGVNRFGNLQVSSTNGETGIWTFSGNTTEVPANTPITLTFTPTLVNAPTEIYVDENGQFTFDLPAIYACEHTIQAQVEDRCGGIYQSPVYAFCLDAVTPSWEITSPSDGSLLTLDQDIDPSLDGLQMALSLSFTDSRTTVDYPVEIACSSSISGNFNVLSLASKLKSEIQIDPTIIVSFPNAGFYQCKIQANTGINTPNFPVKTFQVITSEPLFTLTDPSVTQQQCFDGHLLIAGSAERFNPNQTILEYEILDQSGTAIQNNRLALIGEIIDGKGNYAFDLDLSTANIPDGNYFLRIRGTSDAIPMTILPSDPIRIQIDQNLSVLSLDMPQANQVLGIEQDIDQNLQNCVQAPLDIRVTDAVNRQVCYALNDARPVCGEVNENGILHINQLNYLPGINTISLNSIDCGTNIQTVQFQVETQNCQDPFRIASPVDQAVVSSAQDRDPNVDGIQLNVAIVHAPINSAVQVLVKDQNQQVTSFDGTSDDQGNATVVVTLEAVDQERILELTPVSGDLNGLSTRITQSNLVPTLTLPSFDSTCLGLNATDASSAPGLQLHLTATAQNLAQFQVPTLTMSCENQADLVVQGQLSGPTTAQSIDFDLIDLRFEGNCTFKASALDLSGQLVENTKQSLVDLTAPEITLTRPIITGIFNRLNDLNLSQPGIQLETSASFCNAFGQVSFKTEPVQAEGDLLFDLMGNDTCEEITAGFMSYFQGSQALIISAKDQCDNQTQLIEQIQANEGTTLVVTEPRDQSTIQKSQDLSSTTAGCQIELSAASTGFANTNGLRVAVCATNEIGALDPICGGGVDISRGSCQFRDSEARAIVCSVNLTDGVHEITVASTQNNNQIYSETISLNVDCTAPVVQTISVVEDLDGNACVHQQERANFNSVSPNATINVRFETSGLEDGQTVYLRALPTNQILTSTVVNQNAGRFPAVTLVPGDYQLYLQASDRTGNALPTPDQNSNGILLKDLKIDTTPPIPLTLSPNAGECLPSASDARLNQNGYQALVSVVSGSTNGDMINLSLKVDGVTVQRLATSQSEVSFNPQTIPEGVHQLQILAQDLCGNVGSVAGFQMSNGQARWDQPNPISISVDTQAPTIALAGISANQRFIAENDADQNPINGFQIPIQLNVSGFEAGSEIQVFSNNQRLRTIPDRLLALANQNVISAQVTVPPGINVLQAKGSDLCTNPTTSQSVGIFVDITGCNASITNVTQGKIFGTRDGLVTNTGLQTTIQSTVDLLDPACGQASVDLITNTGNVIATSTVNALDGSVAFDSAILPQGSYAIGLNVRTQQQATPSQFIDILVDLIAPSIQFVDPFALNATALVTADENPALTGQQFSVVANITESQVVTARTATLSVNGVLVRDGLIVANQTSAQIRFSEIDLPIGLATLEICLEDLATNRQCATQAIDADPSIPGIVNANAQVISNRTTEALITFIAPADDGATGNMVKEYEVKYATSNITTDAQWTTATATANQPATALPGDQEAFTLLNILPSNEIVFVAIRAKDDANRLGPINAVQIDLRLSNHTINLSPSNAQSWNGTTFDQTNDNAISSLQDINADGFDDLLIIGTQSGTESIAGLILGTADLSQARLLRLSVPNSMSALYFGVSGANLGDVNGDGTNDIGVLGYTSDFSGSALAIYFGCAQLMGCTDQALGQADSVVTFVGVLRSSVRGVGSMHTVGLHDIFVGGGIDVASYVDTKSGLVVKGRAVWPATLAINSSNPNINDATRFNVNEFNAGAYAQGLGDLDGNGLDEVIFSGGNAFEKSFIRGSVSNQVVNPCTERGVSNFGSFYAGGRDIDNDGVPDFLVANRGDKVISVLKSNQTKIDCLVRGEDQFGKYFDFAGDINLDGEIDLIVTHDDNISTDAWVFNNSGAGIFGTVTASVFRKESIRISTPAQKKLAVAGVGDMNQDGMDDFAVLTFSGGLFKVTVFH
jgi:hypothetical protein